MKKIYVIIILIFFSYTTAFALIPDSISTVYTDGEFVTHYQTKTKSTSKITQEVSDFLVTDFQKTPDNLFNWALKDLGLQEKKKNDLLFILKSSVTDLKTGITHGEFDIVVPYIRTFKEVKVDAIVSKKTGNKNETKITADIIYSSLLLKYAIGTLTFIPRSDNEFLLITNVKIKFGWFFNIFITKHRYKSIVEWRIKKFTENIKNECSKRIESERKKPILTPASIQ
jgi:hypothetical protein